MALSDSLHDIMYAFYKDPSVFTTQWLTGSGIPTPDAPAARVGDLYLNTQNNDIYEWDGFVWTKVGTLGGGGALYAQPNQPDLGIPASGHPLWLDTDEDELALQRVTHPNIDDVLVEAWDEGKGRWQTVHYDSGWRDIAGAVTWYNYSGTPALIARRTNNTVFLKGTWANAAGGGYVAVFTGLPTAFRPGGSTFYMPGVYSGGVGSTIGTIQQGGTCQIIGSGQTATLGFGATYPSDDTIPTSLPGTLISPAPA